MEKDYYERYWHMEMSNKKGVATTPPEWNEVNLNRILKETKQIIKGIILDVGCGSGFFTNEIAKLNGVSNVFGVDISETAVKFARDRYSDVEFKVGEVTNLPFPSQYFDVITSIEVVEHILDVEKMLKEFNRILKSGGYLIITTTDFNLIKKLAIALMFDKYFQPTNPHIRFFTKKTLKDLLENSGFEMIDHKWNGNYFGIMPKGQIMIAKKVRDFCD